LEYRYVTENSVARTDDKTVVFEKLTPLKSMNMKTKKGVAFVYAEGEFENLPQQSVFQNSEREVSDSINILMQRKRNDHFAITYSGYIYIPSTGVYNFYTESDDGSRLSIHNKLVVNNDGSHSKRKRTGIIALEKGYHPFVLEYFEDYEGEYLDFGIISEGKLRSLKSEISISQ